MARRNKFVKGPAITDPVLVCTMILDGKWLYLFDSPQSLEHWSLAMLRSLARAGHICIALPNEESTP